MPQSFQCHYHRALAEAPGADSCWRCQIRETLWANHVAEIEARDRLQALEDFAGAPPPIDAATLPRAPRKKFPGAISNLPVPFRRFFLDEALTFSEFRDDPRCTLKSGGVRMTEKEVVSAWGTIIFWRENVYAVDNSDGK